MIAEIGLILLRIFTYLAAFYLVIVASFYLLFFIFSSVQLRSHYRLDENEPYEELLTSSFTKPVSILVPAFNEEAGIIGSVRSLLSINYPDFEVIVINDGSTDKTLETMTAAFSMVKVGRKVIRRRLETKEVKGVYRSTLYENLYMIDKENGGKSDALNAGINLSLFPYICSLDGDSIIERDAFLKVMKPIVDSDGEVIAAGGSVRIANNCHIERGELMQVGLSKNPLIILQVVEYLRAFLMGRVGLSRHNLLLIVSGAFGIFNKEWVVEANGYRTDTVGEDMELVVHLHRLIREKGENKRIEYIPEPVVWTEAPESLRILRRQRSRWHRGLFQSLWLHKKMLFNPKYGTIGIISMPSYFIVELLGPIVELFGYLLIILSPFMSGVYVKGALLLFLLLLLYGSLLSMSAVLLEEWSIRRYPNVSQIIKLFFWSLTESFWYRPLTVIWRVEGLIQVLQKNNQWGKMTRKGISK
ncbi:glycosyltransferase family 2 protein [Bacillus taeanensis]|uniref:Glycosyltransferase family 2 protein n=1 Tax=Bacillus taeanensis TaxID=273032 RepID=A0A366XYM6_9BACI|nr:glycosyltransferase [Bacillus taeanensis]RBW71510.1 glycosyltransferase family 2 protein [Bacillus taeanensis]